MKGISRDAFQFVDKKDRNGFHGMQDGKVWIPCLILETANSTEGVKTCSFPMASLLLHFTALNPTHFISGLQTLYWLSYSLMCNSTSLLLEHCTRHQPSKLSWYIEMLSQCQYQDRNQALVSARSLTPKYLVLITDFEFCCTLCSVFKHSFVQWKIF